LAPGATSVMRNTAVFETLLPGPGLTTVTWVVPTGAINREIMTLREQRTGVVTVGRLVIGEDSICQSCRARVVYALGTLAGSGGS